MPNAKRITAFTSSIILGFLIITGCTPKPKVVCYNATGTDCICYLQNLYRMCHPEWLDGYGTCILTNEPCPE
jgi:hypothetical protein